MIRVMTIIMNSEIKKIIERLVNKDKNKTLEVEHLLELLHTNNNDLVQPLIELKQNCNWGQTNNELIIPFGTWTDIICEYLENGYSRLTSIGKFKNELFPFVIGVLEELKTKESFDSLCTILTSLDLNSEEDLPFVLKTISTINFVTSFKGSPDVETRQAKLATDYIVATISKLLASAVVNEKDIANCILSLRGIGNVDTIEFIRKLSPLIGEEYVGINKLTINSIQKRLKQNSIT